MNRDLKGLQEALDLAVDDAQNWERACNCAVDLLGATGAILVPTNPAFRGVWMSCSTRLKTTLGEYIAGDWHLRDPREHVTKRMLTFGYATDDDIFPDRAVKAEIPFYKDFLYRHNFGVLTAARILTPNGYWGLMLHFANDHPPISENEVLILDRIRSLFEEAATRADQIAHERIAAFVEFFRGTRSEIYILDVDGNQCFSINNNGELSAQNRSDTIFPMEMGSELGSQLREICASDPTLSLSNTYQIKDGDQNKSVLVVQIPPKLRHYFMRFKVCAIVTECNGMDAWKQQRLREEYLLSDAEVSTVDLLSAGKTPNLIADIMSLKATSIRQRLKVIYEKTNVNSQVELVALYNQL